MKALATLASKLEVDQKKLLSQLKSTTFAISEGRGQKREPTDAELMALVIVANTYGLNPMTKEIYAFPKKGGGIEPMVSIDGWLRIINEHPQFDGLETTDIEEDGKLVACECVIHRRDRNHPTRIREYLAECKRETEPWNGMPHRMLRHKAIIQCGRIALSLTGIADEDEARTAAESERSVSGRVVDPEKEETDEMLVGLSEDKPKGDTVIDLDVLLKEHAHKNNMATVQFIREAVASEELEILPNFIAPEHLTADQKKALLNWTP